MLVASLLATSGSVIAKAERISPSSSGSSQVPLLLVGAEQVQQLHVAGVGRLAVDRLGSELVAPAGQLRDRGVLQLRQAGLRGQEQVPQAALARLRLELLDDRRHACGRRAGARARCAWYAASAGSTRSRMKATIASRSSAAWADGAGIAGSAKASFTVLLEWFERGSGGCRICPQPRGPRKAA